jgi:hypothetical protein
MSSYQAKQDLENAKVNANNVIIAAKKLDGTSPDLSIAIQSIGYSLHAIARAMEQMNK